MKNHITFTILASFILVESAKCATSVRLEFGNLTTSTTSILPGNTLWAIISESPLGNLPGGLLANGAFSVSANAASINTDFAGETIAPGEQIGGGVVLAVGGTSTSDLGKILSTVGITISTYAALGLNEGDKFGVYWFPGRTPTSNSIPSSGGFEIGGFHRSLASPGSGGNFGMAVPADAIPSVTVAYFDSSLTGGDTSFDDSFQAIAVPEPTSLVLTFTATLLLLRRKRV